METVAIVKQLKITLGNRMGVLAELCTELAKLAVNIHAIDASDVRPVGTVRLVVTQLDKAKRMCESLGLKYEEEQALAINVVDRPGALGRITRKLAEKGIDILYVYGTIEKGSKRALIVLGVSDIEAAARVAR